MVIRSYEDLEVYRRSYKLALDIHRISYTLPKSERYELSNSQSSYKHTPQHCLLKGMVEKILKQNSSTSYATA